MKPVTERDMLNLLLERYTSIRPASIADRWVRAEHVQVSLMASRRKRVADFVAADKYPADPTGTGLAFHGHEVKVSRSDWLTELSDPSKADALKRYMHHWWLVVPDASIVKPGELPEGWGLLTISAGDKLRAKVSAPRLTPDPMPIDLAMSLMSAAARTAYRDPLRRDAPIAYRDRDPSWTAYCGFCYELAPCPIHQPRWHARTQELHEVAP